MATYTFTTTPQQEALLTWIVTQANAQKETSFTNAQYVQARFPTLLEPYLEHYKNAVAKTLTVKFNAADAATRQQVVELLGMA